MSEKRRQSLLLGALAAVAVVYLWYAGILDFGGGDDPFAAGVPPIDAAALERQIRDISTVDPSLILFEHGDSVADRNLFQYGQRKPPPPDPAELERQRLAAQEALALQEQQARAQKQREAEAAAQAAAEAAKVAENRPPPPPPKPQGPVKPAPPPITFKYVGVLGPKDGRIGVFLEGDNQLLAKKGEVIQGKFRILEVAVEWADVGYVDPELKNESKRILLGL